ncbi:MAG: hypothetical protein ABSF26_19290 [Thermoguttaceae bacterium]
MPLSVDQPSAGDPAPVVPGCRDQPGSAHRLLDALDLGFLARGYYANDQRVQWSGNEATFGAEAVLTTKLNQQVGEWEIKFDGEFYLNQPFDRDMLLDTPERRSYAADFQPDTLEISKLSVALSRGDMSVVLGKIETPFGRTYFPLYTNSRLDAPFIRTEAIGWRETGVLLHYQPGMLVGDVALTNGGEDRDTNSSKAVVARLGLQGAGWALGCSAKYQDGVGSEEDKEYDNHVGADAMIRLGRWVLSGEAIYDQYGFRKPGFDPDDITWYRSIYYRDESSGTTTPLTGVGYYLNLGYQERPWTTMLNYGEFYPVSTATAPNQRPERRGIGKVAYRFLGSLEVYSVVMVENGGYTAQNDAPRRGLVLLDGLQYSF